MGVAGTRLPISSFWSGPEVCYDGLADRGKIRGGGRDAMEPIERAMTECSGREVYRESPASDYRRTFELDPAIDTTKVSAKMEQGVLTLHLPKAESVKPRKIAVNG